jgi:diguanylate cyclase (GGDEF)-like protein
MGKKKRQKPRAVAFIFLLFFLNFPPVFSQSVLDEAKNEARNGDVAHAIMLLQNEVQSNPQDEEAHLFLGNLYFSVHLYSDALQEYQTVFSLDPKNITALNNMGVVEEALGNLQEALNDYKKVEAAQPSFLPVHQNLAFIYAKIGDFQGALNEYQILTKNGQGLSIAVSLATLFLQKKNFAGAESILLSYLKTAPEDANAWDMLAQAYWSDQKAKEAWEASLQATKLNPNNGEFWVTRGLCAEAVGKYLDAKQAAQKAIDLLPTISPTSLKAKQILEDVQAHELAEWKHIFMLGLLFVFFFFSIIVLYFWRRIHFQGSPKDQTLQKFEEDLQTFGDFQELADFLVAYFSDFFKIPKGMLFLTTTDGTELKCVSSNLKVLLFNKMEMNPDFAQKWMRVHKEKIMTTIQAYRTHYFHEAFPTAKEVLEKHDMRLVIPLCERGKILGILFLGGITKIQFREQLGKIRKKSELGRLLAQKSATTLETLKLLEISTIDELTQVYNKRFFRQALLEELKRVERYNQPCSLLMLDIDHFKQLNDTFGHPQGDVVLKHIAKILKENVREGMDSVSRYGGEEFVVILPATDEEKASETAERIRLAVYNSAFPGLPPGKRVSVSIGVACYPHHAATDWELIKVADQALYQSKKSGRNRVTVAEQVFPTDVQGKVFEETDVHTMRSIPPFHSFQFRFEGESRRALEEKSPLSIAILEIVNVSQIQNSSRLLVQISSLAQPFLRVVDFYASDKEGRLLFMFAEKTAKEAVFVMEQICSKIEGTSFVGIPVKVKCVAGIASFPEDGQMLEDLFSHAQGALNGALKQGMKVLAYQDLKQLVS